MGLKKINYEYININEIVDNISSSYIDNFKYEKLKIFIQNYGQLKNIVVFKVNKKYIIIDGYILYKCMKELNYKEIYVSIIPLKTEEEALLLSLLLNIKFDSDWIKLANVIKKLLCNYELNYLSEVLPYDKTEIEKYPLLLEYDFKKHSNEVYNNLFMENNDEYF